MLGGSLHEMLGHPQYTLKIETDPKTTFIQVQLGSCHSRFTYHEMNKTHKGKTLDIFKDIHVPDPMEYFLDSQLIKYKLTSKQK